MKIHGTAKGGALSTKDFGVAFGGAVAPVIARIGSWSMATRVTTLTHENGAGTNRIMVVVTSGEDNNATRTVTGIDYGGQALTKDEVLYYGTYQFEEIWYLLEAEIASASNTTITVTYSFPPNNSLKMIHAGTYENVNQTAPMIDEDSDYCITDCNVTNNPLTDVSIVEANGNALVAAANNSTPTTVTWNSPMTIQTDSGSGDTGHTLSVADRLSTTDDNIAIEATYAFSVKHGTLAIEIAKV